MSREQGQIAAAWWRALQPPDDASPERRGDRAALARLRRCATVMDAATERASLDLCRKLALGEAGLKRACLAAAVLAHVRQDVRPERVARQLGAQRDGTAAMSELRFRRLVQADTADEQLTAFRRLVALAGRKLNVADLAEALLHWDDARRRRWAYAYYDAPDFEASLHEDIPA